MSESTGIIAVLDRPGASFEFREVTLPSPRAGELLVRIELCTICGSDLHTFHGRRPLPGPAVLGHEMIGRVVGLSPAGPLADLADEPIQVGDRITWSIYASCGVCFFCRAGMPAKCERLFKYGHEGLTAEYPSTGGFATHCQLRAGTTLVRVPDVLPNEVACPINCATSTVAAAFRHLEPDDGHEGQCVVIFGAGMLGLTAAAMASDRGAHAILVVEPQSARADRALQFGATHVVSDLVSAKSHVCALTDGRGADVAMDFSGNNEAVLGSIHFLRTGGRAVLAGTVFPTESISLSPEQIVRRCLRVSGVHNYAPQDMRTAVEFLCRVGNRFPFASLVEPVYELGQLDAAVAEASQGTRVRVGIRSGGPRVTDTC